MAVLDFVESDDGGEAECAPARDAGCARSGVQPMRWRALQGGRAHLPRFRGRD